MNTRDTITLTATLGGFAAALKRRGLLSSDDLSNAALAWEEASTNAEDPSPVLEAAAILHDIAASLNANGPNHNSGILEAELAGRLHAIETVLQEISVLSLIRGGTTPEQASSMGTLSRQTEEQKSVEGPATAEHRYSVIQRMIHHLERLWGAIASEVAARTPPARP